MKIKNIFESSRFVYFMNKLICNLCLTFRKIKGTDNYISTTTSLDFLVFVMSICASLLAFADIMKMPLKQTSRSLILELSMFANGKSRTIQPLLVITTSFFNRFKYFELLRAIQTIDNYVGKVGIDLD